MTDQKFLRVCLGCGLVVALFLGALLAVAWTGVQDSKTATVYGQGDYSIIAGDDLITIELNLTAYGTPTIGQVIFYVDVDGWNTTASLSTEFNQSQVHFQAPIPVPLIPYQGTQIVGIVSHAYAPALHWTSPYYYLAEASIQYNSTGA